MTCWGRNTDGQLGVVRDWNDSSTDGWAVPRIVDLNGAGAVEISSGYAHTCAILDNGSVACWGGNNRGQLGYGGEQDYTEEGTIRLVSLPENRSAVAIDAWGDHTCAVLEDGSMVCWGGGNDGALGNGGLEDMYAPEEVALPPGRSAEIVSVGPSLTCTILDDMTVMCWGNNDYGQLGGGNISEGTVASPSFPVSLPEGTMASSIDSGMFHSCIISTLGSVFCWGSNGYGQLGDGEELSLIHI